MAYTSISAIQRNEAFEDFIEDFIDDYGMGFIQELYPDKAIYSMDKFNDLLCGMEPLDIACRVNFGDMNMNDDYFIFNGYGNIETLSEWELHSYLWDSIRYDLDKFHEYLMDYYTDEYEPAFKDNFPIIEEVEELPIVHIA